MPKSSDWAVRKVKSFRGNEGLGFNAELMWKTHPVAFAMDDAGGGGPRIDWYRDALSQKAKKAFEDYWKALPPDRDPMVLECFPDGMPASEDSAITALVCNHETNHQLRKWCRRNVVFVLKEDAIGHYRRVAFKGFEEYTRICASVQAKYKDKGVRILNPEIEGGVPTIHNESKAVCKT